MWWINTDASNVYAYTKGKSDWKRGITIEENPFSKEDDCSTIRQHDAWREGWLDQDATKSLHQ